MSMRLFFWMLGLLAGINTPAFALTQVDLYGVTVEVADLSAETREAAQLEGFRIVARRLAGQRDWQVGLASDALQQAASQTLAEFAYTPEEPPRLQLRFTPGLVEAWLQEQGVAVWQNPRAEALAWVVVSSGGRRTLLTADSTADVRLRLADAAQDWGLALKFPEREQAMALTTSDIWGFFEGAIRSASQPIAADLVLVVRLDDRAGSWQGDWRLLDSLETFASDRFTAASQAQGMQALASGVAAALSSRYAVDPRSDTRESLQIQVSDLHDYEDYAECMDWLSSLPVVADLTPVRLLDRNLDLQLTLQGSIQQFERFAALQPRWERVAGGSDGSYVFRWQAAD